MCRLQSYLPLFEHTESGKAESSVEVASPANSSTISSGHPSEVSSLDEHHVEEDQRYRQLLDSDKGEVLESEDTIILEDVPIVTPNKDVVATGLSFQVRKRYHCVCMCVCVCAVCVCKFTEVYIIICMVPCATVF